MPSRGWECAYRHLALALRGRSTGSGWDICLCTWDPSNRLGSGCSCLRSRLETQLNREVRGIWVYALARHQGEVET